MRVSLLPGLIDAAKRNLSRGLTDLAIFEEGSVFLPAKTVEANPELPVGNVRPTDAQLQQLLGSIPAQPSHVAGLFAGYRMPQQVGLKSVEANYSHAIFAARVVAQSVGLDLIIRQASPVGFHPGRSAQLFVSANDQEIAVGFAGELDPQLSVVNDLPRRVGVFEIDLDILFAAAPTVIQATPLLVMPAATQDLSLVVEAELPAGALLEVIRAGAGPLLEKVVLVDDYRGSNVEPGYKSLTFALRFRAPDRTLTQAEASEARDAAVKLANQKFGATLRA
jgi:phenylalanyl-tRNA synthetase beta chain